MAAPTLTADVARTVHCAAVSEPATSLASSTSTFSMPEPALLTVTLSP